MILKCDCYHEYQDRRYGQGKRVHNACQPGEPRAYRCTVCRRERAKKEEKR